MENSQKTQLTTIIIAAFILISGIVGGVYVYNQKEAEIKTLTMEKSGLNETIQKRDSVVNDMEGTFAEIESNMTFIKEKRSQIATMQTEGGKNKKTVNCRRCKTDECDADRKQQENRRSGRKVEKVWYECKIV